MGDLTLSQRFRVMASTGMGATIQPADLKAAAELLDRADRAVAACERLRKSRAEMAAACEAALLMVRRAERVVIATACVSFVLGAVFGWVLS